LGNYLPLREDSAPWSSTGTFMALKPPHHTAQDSLPVTVSSEAMWNTAEVKRWSAVSREMICAFTVSRNGGNNPGKTTAAIFLRSSSVNYGKINLK
jgi:hypothetical protein